MKIILISFLLLILNLNSSLAQTFDVEYASGENYKTAGFRFWFPEKKEKIKALLVVVPGYNTDGRDAVNEKAWQDFAREYKLGIVACYFRDKENPDILYREASKGSGQALIDAISELAAKAEHPEIKSAPLVLFGQSAGGQFNYEFACWKPEKVLTFIVNKGGFYHTAIAPEATRKIPAIFFLGENDLYYRKDLIKGIYSVNRRFGAFWTLISEKNTAHKFEASKMMALEYFKNIIPLRLSPSNKLRDVSGDEFYLGDWSTKTIEKYTGQKDADSLTIWLPNLKFAEFWKEIYK